VVGTFIYGGVTGIPGGGCECSYCCYCPFPSRVRVVIPRDNLYIYQIRSHVTSRSCLTVPTYASDFVNSMPIEEQTFYFTSAGPDSSVHSRPPRDFVEGILISMLDKCDNSYRAQPARRFGRRCILFVFHVFHQTAMDHQQAILKVLRRENDLAHSLTRGDAGIHAKASALAPTRRT
jgi:hypothetical protein